MKKNQIRKRAESVVREQLDAGLDWSKFDAVDYPDAVLYEADRILGSMFFIVGYIR